MSKPKPTHEQVVKRFWKKVDKNGPIHPILKTPCWLWTGTVNNGRYGVFGVNGKNVLAHRFSYTIQYGPLLSTKQLTCHKCDVKLCVNPQHLYAGNHTTNQSDAMDRGQWKCPQRAKGKDHPSAKLNERDVLEIRRLAKVTKHKELAITYNVSIHLIRSIIYRQSWKHI